MNLILMKDLLEGYIILWCKLFCPKESQFYSAKTDSKPLHDISCPHHCCHICQQIAPTQRCTWFQKQPQSDKVAYSILQLSTFKYLGFKILHLDSTSVTVTIAKLCHNKLYNVFVYFTVCRTSRTSCTCCQLRGQEG